jgi:hypothetical protein
LPPIEKRFLLGEWELSCAGDKRRFRNSDHDDPVSLYQDLLVGLIQERRLNNGQPSGHAMLIARADPRPGEHAVHIGAAVGYYTAILAHMVGDTGRVTAIEYDPGLAARLAVNLAGQPNSCTALRWAAGRVRKIWRYHGLIMMLRQSRASLSARSRADRKQPTPDPSSARRPLDRKDLMFMVCSI